MSGRNNFQVLLILFILYLVYRYVSTLHCLRLRINDRHFQERNKFFEVQLAEHVRKAPGHDSVPKYSSR